MSRTRTLTALFALGRLAFGVGLIARPDRVGGGWLGSDSEREPVKIVLRGLGARDVALSAGALAALGREDRLAPWLAGAIACDRRGRHAGRAPDSLPGNARWGTVALAAERPPPARRCAAVKR